LLCKLLTADAAALRGAALRARPPARALLGV
jgi:hypothetical protein